MSGKASLQNLLDQAARKFSVSLSLLERIVVEERARLYLGESSRTNVIENIRKMIQEEAQKRE
jgi:hypothetical protein